MFERFTERARQVVVLAQEEARTFNHHFIGTQHLLLGLLREEEGLGCRVLEHLDVTIDRVRQEVRQRAGQGEAPLAKDERLPFTPCAQKVLELALREALGLGHNYIGTEHILLGLVRLDEGQGAQILGAMLNEPEAADHPAASEKIRNEVIRMLSGPRQRRPGPPELAALTEEHIRGAHPNLGSVHVKHRQYANLRGTLVAYDWPYQRCTVRLEVPDVDGEFTVPLGLLVIDDGYRNRLRITG